MHLGYIPFGLELPPLQLNWTVQTSRSGRLAGGALLLTSCMSGQAMMINALFVCIMLLLGQRVTVLIIGHSIVFWAG